MKKDTTFFTSTATILKQESVMDSVRDIAGQQGREDPFFVLDVGDIVKKIKVWRLKLPRVEPYYAVKCNDNQTVLETLASLGTGFDCASKGEMQKIKDLGVDSNRIIYAHPCKPVSHLRHAYKMDIRLMTFDNETELYKVKNTFPQAKLVLRIRCDAEKALCNLGIKFGVMPEDAPPLLRTAWDLGLDVVGVSFHVGSGCQEPAVFKRAIAAARSVLNEAESIGFSPYLLDIGGGYPGTSDSTLDELAYYINTALEEHFPENSGYKIIAEPGRYIVASAFTLATNIISRRDICDDIGENTSYMYYINEGVYGSFNCILTDHQHPYPTILREGIKDDLLPSSIWGPTCDGLDCVVPKMKLPKLELGDWLVWENMGAYTLSCSSGFNGFPKASVFVVMPIHTWLYLEEYLGAAITNYEGTSFDEEKEEHNQRQEIEQHIDDQQLTDLEQNICNSNNLNNICVISDDSLTVNSFLASIALTDG